MKPAGTDSSTQYFLLPFLLLCTVCFGYCSPTTFGQSTPDKHMEPSGSSATPSFINTSIGTTANQDSRITDSPKYAVIEPPAWPGLKITDQSTANRQHAQLLPPKCRFQHKKEVQHEKFLIDKHPLPLEYSIAFIESSPERKCYFNRDYLESKLNATSGPEVIVDFSFICLDPGMEVIFLDHENEDELGRSTQRAFPVQDDLAQNPNSSQNKTESSYFPPYIVAFEIASCKFHVSVLSMLASMADLRLLTVSGTGVWDLSELHRDPTLCHGFTDLVFFNIGNDMAAQDHLHHLVHCNGHLDNVVDMMLFNNRLMSFPEELREAIPNLRSLDMRDNSLRVPVQFPWRPGFAKLPRNLSRTDPYNAVYCYDGAFDLEPDLFRKVLSLDRNIITSLINFRFQGDFQYITLEENYLGIISEDVFYDSLSLQFLNLALNDLTSLPENLFSTLINLTRLDLHGNKLETLPTELFRSLHKLKILHLHQNRLTVLQTGLFTDLKDIKELRLDRNEIIHISGDAFSVSHVHFEVLDLHLNPLTEVPMAMFTVRGLTHVNLDNTHIEVLDFVEIAKRVSLVQLVEALDNPTTGDGVGFEKTLSMINSKLRSVRLYNATVETYSAFWIIVKNVKIVIEGSPLLCDYHILNVTHVLQGLVSSIPVISDWTCTSPTELSGKTVASLQDNETYCQIDEGDDKHTALSCPPGCTCYVRTGTDLVMVDCINATLTSLPPTAPANTRELRLQNNTIKQLENRPYLRQLRSLLLTANNVQNIPTDIQLNMPFLETFHMDNNWLTGLDEGFVQVKRLKDVRLAGNPFRCDCQTGWMKNWLLGHHNVVTDFSEIKCSTEGSDDGQILVAVPDAEFVCKTSASLRDLALPIAVPMAFAVILMLASGIIFIHRRSLKVCLYIHTGFHSFDRDISDNPAKYDVTVCCDENARAWVLENVVHPLENNHNYTVFFYSRDSYVGFTTSENLRHCVKNSRRLVVVLGSHWDRQDLLVTATREALAKCRKEMVHFMTVLVHQVSAKDIDNKDIREYIKSGRYINTNDKYFLKKLVFEMPHLKKEKIRRTERPTASLSRNILSY